MSPDAFIVGGDGLIGGAVAHALNGKSIASTRRDKPGAIFLDLLNPPETLPQADVAYLCAGVNGFKQCEGNCNAWRTNVDGVLAVAKTLNRQGSFLVYISTAAVEWSAEMYARQRAMVEIGLNALCDPAIIRPEKVTADNAAEFAAFVIAIGSGHRAGIHHWPD